MAKMDKKCSHTFVGEMKVSTNTYPSNFATKTMYFSPLLDDSITFHFHAIHEIEANVLDMVNPNSILELTLKKVNIQSTSSKFSMPLMNVDVKVYYSDGSLFKEYTPQSNIKLDQLKALVFETVVKETRAISRGRVISSEHSIKMKDNALTIKCKMSFTYPDVKCYDRAESSSRFTKNLKSVYESCVFNDFIFNVGDKIFPVHKVILAAHSPVFMRMMTQDFQESKTNSVTITDATPAIFDLFLKHLYSGEIEDKSWNSVKDLYCLADKYDVEILKKDCINTAISLMSVDLVCEILKLAHTYDDANLKSVSRQFAVNNIKELISREDWKDLVAMYPIIGYEITVNFVPK